MKDFLKTQNLGNCVEVLDKLGCQNQLRPKHRIAPTRVQFHKVGQQFFSSLKLIDNVKKIKDWQIRYKLYLPQQPKYYKIYAINKLPICALLPFINVTPPSIR